MNRDDKLQFVHDLYKGSDNIYHRASPKARHIWNEVAKAL